MSEMIELLRKLAAGRKSRPARYACAGPAFESHMEAAVHREELLAGGDLRCLSVFVCHKGHFHVGTDA